MRQSGKRVRPEWSRASSAALVFLGGCAGAAAREALVAWIPQAAPIPVAVLVANLLGAFLLGALLESLVHGTSRRAARARLLLGTGGLGGFTTYSALALATTELVVDGRPWLALAYGGGTLILGALASWAGIAAGAALRRRSGGGAHA